MVRMQQQRLNFPIFIMFLSPCKLMSVPLSISTLSWHTKSSRPSTKTRADPDVRIKLPFNPFLFAGALEQLGMRCKQQRGHTIYGITSYQSPLY